MGDVRDKMGAAGASKYRDLRREMVERQIRRRGVHDPLVLGAMEAVPRHEFVPAAVLQRAYEDSPLAIGEGQAISQPYMVAAMTEALELTGSQRVLEIGAGSGYQAAVLSLLAREVVAIEFRPLLARAARERLTQLGYSNVSVEIADGSEGWPTAAPYDAILAAAAAPAVPAPLIEQLAEGGRLVIPIGTREQQELHRIRKTDGRIEDLAMFACRFVPLVGRHAWPDVTRS
ncbi:MAG: protein-L-isoaspartate(D-aspartate) O-methyltransferase [Candidatus Acidiferrales bacterium]